jgi:hypothetical protein
LAASAVVMRLVLRGTDCLESKVNSIVFREKVAWRSSERPVFAPHQQYRALHEPAICSNHPKPPTTTLSSIHAWCLLRIVSSRRCCRSGQWGLAGCCCRCRRAAVARGDVRMCAPLWRGGGSAALGASWGRRPYVKFFLEPFGCSLLRKKEKGAFVVTEKSLSSRCVLRVKSIHHHDHSVLAV